jgi:hypothetical protein
MTIARAPLAAVLLASAAVIASACEKRDAPPKPDLKIETTYERFAAQLEASAPPAGPAPSEPQEMRTTPPLEPQAPSHITIDREMLLEAGTGPGPRILTRTITQQNAVDPDQAILDDAHMRAARCYDGFIFNAAPRTATIDVTVIPTGSVTHAEVRSTDTREPQVLACLKALGEGLRFTERLGTNAGNRGGGLRTYAIDVAVVPAH